MWWYSSAESSPRKRKRLRSRTPSEAGGSVNGDDGLRSPLAKRKKLAAERAGASKLKEAVSADDLEQDLVALPEVEPDTVSAKSSTKGSTKGSAPATPARESGEGEEEEEDEDDDSDDSSDSDDDGEDDDFLAREMGEDWG